MPAKKKSGSGAGGEKKNLTPKEKRQARKVKRATTKQTAALAFQGLKEDLSALGKLSLDSKPKEVLDEKGQLVLGGTGSARVDFFFKAVRGLSSSNLNSHLVECWTENPLDTLKLIYQTRDCRGGKGEKAIFHQALLWLEKMKPATLELNLHHIPTFGTWKDLLVLVGTSCEKKVLHLFAEQLQKDMDILKELEDLRKQENIEQQKIAELKKTISLCSKWAPSENKGKDVCHAAHKLARILFPKSKACLREYRQHCIAPLRKEIHVTEVMMCAQKWKSIGYQGVPSRCMNLCRKAFAKHDTEGFQQFLMQVRAGNKTIKGLQMFPHELASYYMTKGKLDEVIELQWMMIREDLKKAGTLKGALALSDVSGSMSGIPMQVSIALGILISQLAAEPFAGLIITFDSIPQFHSVKGESLYEQVKDVQAMSWGGSTNFQGALDLILNKAVASKLKPEDMPTKLFVFSDMQFDQADSSFGSQHNLVKAKYQKAGYPMPQLVYWNLRANTPGFPVNDEENGTCLLSGFSPSLLKTVMDQSEYEEEAAKDKEEAQKEEVKVNPLTTVMKAIEAEKYNCLKVAEMEM